MSWADVDPMLPVFDPATVEAVVAGLPPATEVPPRPAVKPSSTALQDWVRGRPAVGRSDERRTGRPVRRVGVGLALVAERRRLAGRRAGRGPRAARATR
jgi:hypothetical protein